MELPTAATHKDNLSHHPLSLCYIRARTKEKLEPQRRPIYEENSTITIATITAPHHHTSGTRGLSPWTVRGWSVGKGTGGRLDWTLLKRSTGLGDKHGDKHGDQCWGQMLGTRRRKSKGGKIMKNVRDKAWLRLHPRSSSPRSLKRVGERKHFSLPLDRSPHQGCRRIWQLL